MLKKIYAFMLISLTSVAAAAQAGTFQCPTPADIQAAYSANNNQGASCTFQNYTGSGTRCPSPVEGFTVQYQPDFPNLVEQGYIFNYASWNYPPIQRQPVCVYALPNHSHGYVNAMVVFYAESSSVQGTVVGTGWSQELTPSNLANGISLCQSAGCALIISS